MSTNLRVVTAMKIIIIKKIKKSSAATSNSLIKSRALAFQGKKETTEPILHTVMMGKCGEHGGKTNPIELLTEETETTAPQGQVLHEEELC